MRLRLISKDGVTGVVNVETGESIPVTAVRFEHRSCDDPPELTITLPNSGNDIEVDAEVETKIRAVQAPAGWQKGRPAMEADD